MRRHLNPRTAPVHAIKKNTLVFLLFVIGSFVFGIYACSARKNVFFDKIVGCDPEFSTSYNKGFSQYSELIYSNKHNDDYFFAKVIKDYESSLNSKKHNFKKVYFQGPMCELRSLPFREFSKDKIKKQVTFKIKDWREGSDDWREGTDICDGGEFIVIRSYSQR